MRAKHACCRTLTDDAVGLWENPVGGWGQAGNRQGAFPDDLEGARIRAVKICGQERGTKIPSDQHQRCPVHNPQALLLLQEDIQKKRTREERCEVPLRA